MRRFCSSLLILLLLSFLLQLLQCAPFKPNAEIYPAPKDGFWARRTQLPLRPEPADAAVIFIGGFSEQALIHMRSLYEQLPPPALPGKQFRAYYAWDGGRGCLLYYNTRKIQREVDAFCRVNPGAPLVFIGHSYGGSAVMDVLRHLTAPHGPVFVVTLDPVSRREKSHPRERAEGVRYWLNVYCAPYRTPRDVVPKIGGPWRHCPQADLNVVFSGKALDAEKTHYQHAHPKPLMTESNNSVGKAPSDLLNEALKAYAASASGTGPGTRFP